MNTNFNFLKTYFRNIPIIILCMAAMVYIANKYINYATPMYESTAKLKLADINEGVEGNNLFKDLDVFVSTTKIATEIEVIKSNILINKALDKMEFDQTISRSGKVKDTDTYSESPIIIQSTFQDQRLYNKDIYIQLIDTTSYSISIDDLGISNIIRNMDQSIQFEGGSIIVSLNRDAISKKPNIKIIDNYTFKKYDRATLVSEIQKNLDVMSVEKDIPIVKISFKSVVPEKAAAFVNTLAQAYIEDYIQVKYQAAHTTTQFLDRQINEINYKLESAENKIQNYRDDKNIINIHQETETDLRKLSQLKIQQTNVKMNLNAIQELNTYVKNGKDNFLQLATNFEAFTDLLSTEMIKKIKELQSEKKELLLTYTDADDRVKLVDRKISDYTQYLIESVNNTEKNLKTKYNDLSLDIQELEKVFIGLPEKEKLMNVMDRDFEIYQQSYNFLTNKKIEAQIAQAAKLSFHRILSPAQISQMPTSPNTTVILCVSALIGLFIGILLIALIDAFTAKVTNASNIEKSSQIPVLYNTPNIKAKESTSPFFLKAAHILNIKKVIGDNSIICISSAKDKEGKSFHAYHLAESLGIQGKKVLLIDLNSQMKQGAEDNGVITHSKLENVLYLGLDTQVLAKLSYDHIESMLDNYSNQYYAVIINNEEMATGQLSSTMINMADTNLIIVDTVHTQQSLIKEHSLLCEEYQYPNPYFIINRYGFRSNFFNTLKRSVANTFGLNKKTFFEI